MKKLFIQSICIGMTLSFFVGVDLIRAEQEVPQSFESSQDRIAAQERGDNLNVLGVLRRSLALGLDTQLGLFGMWSRPASRTLETYDSVSDFSKDPTFPLREIAITGMWTFVRVISWWTGLVGWLFDWQLIKVTPASSDWGDLSGVHIAIEAAWKIIRDIASLVIIFSLLYLGIKTIVQGNGFADRKTLGLIIVAAIFVNFSLVLTKDVAFHLSNKVGHQILEQVKTTSGEQLGIKSYSASMLGIIGPQSLFQDQNPSDMARERNWGQIFALFGQVIFLSLILLICMWIFVALILVLMYRFFVFIMLIIFSPLGFVSFTIPWLKSHGQWWWDQLKKQTFFFPAFVFCMYIIFLIIANISFTSTNFAFDWGSNVIEGTVSWLFNFILIIGFLFLLIILPSKIGSAGASLITSAGKWSGGKVRNFAARNAGRVVFGAPAAAGRNIVGRYAAKIVNDDKWKEKAQQTGFKGSVARTLMREADKAQNYSFDLRSTKAIGGFSKKYGFGDAQKGWSEKVKGKKEALEDKAKKEKKLFGYDKMTDTTENRVKIAQAQTQRENKETELNEHKIHLDEVRKRDGVTEAEINVALDYVKKAEEELKTLETEVGRLKNIGDEAYFKNVTSRAQNIKQWAGKVVDRTIKGVTRGKIEGRTTAAALEKMRKDMNKQWQQAGESKDKKDDSKKEDTK